MVPVVTQPQGRSHENLSGQVILPQHSSIVSIKIVSGFSTCNNNRTAAARFGNLNESSSGWWGSSGRSGNELMMANVILVPRPTCAWLECSTLGPAPRPRKMRGRSQGQIYQLTLYTDSRTEAKLLLFSCLCWRKETNNFLCLCNDGLSFFYTYFDLKSGQIETWPTWLVAPALNFPPLFMRLLFIYVISPSFLFTSWGSIPSGCLQKVMSHMHIIAIRIHVPLLNYRRHFTEHNIYLWGKMRTSTK